MMSNKAIHSSLLISLTLLLSGCATNFYSSGFEVDFKRKHIFPVVSVWVDKPNMPASFPRDKGGLQMIQQIQSNISDELHYGTNLIVSSTLTSAQSSMHHLQLSFQQYNETSEDLKFKIVKCQYQASLTVKDSDGAVLFNNSANESGEVKNDDFHEVPYQTKDIDGCFEARSRLMTALLNGYIDKL